MARCAKKIELSLLRRIDKAGNWKVALLRIESRVKSPALETTPGWKAPVAGNDHALEKTWRWKMPRTILTSLWLETSPVLEAAFVWTKPFGWNKPLAGKNPGPERTLGWKEPGAGNSPWAGKSP